MNLIAVDRRSLSAALGVWLATMLALSLHLDDPWWAAISAYRISDPDRQTEFTLGAHRIIGTILGCILGYQLALHTQNVPWAQLFALFIVAAFGTYQRFTSYYTYAWFLGALMPIILIAVAIEDPTQTLDWAYFRTLEVVVGVIAIMLVDGLLAPWRDPAAPPAPGSTALLDQAAITKAALVAGASVVVITLIWTGYDLPSGPQILLTTLAMLSLDFAQTLKKGVMRAVGCLAGGGGGLLMAGLSIESFWLWSILFFIGLMIAARLHHSRGPNAYIGTQAGFGFIVAMVTGSGPPDSILPAVDRLAGISLGVMIMVVLYLVVESAFEPSRPPR